MLTGLRNKRLSDASLFIDDGTTGDQVVTMTVNMSENPYENDLAAYQLSSLSNDVIFAGDPKRLSGYSDAENIDGVITFINEGDGSLSFEATLKNGVQSSEIGLTCYGFSLGFPQPLCFDGVLNTPISYEIEGGGSGSFDTSKPTSVKNVTGVD